MLKLCIVIKTLKQVPILKTDYGLGTLNYDDLKSLVLYYPHSSFSVNFKNTLGLIPLWFKFRPQKFPIQGCIRIIMSLVISLFE